MLPSFNASMVTESAGFLRLGRFWSCLARYSSIVVESVCPLGGIMWNYGLVWWQWMAVLDSRGLAIFEGDPCQVVWISCSKYSDRRSSDRSASGISCQWAGKGIGWFVWRDDCFLFTTNICRWCHNHILEKMTFIESPPPRRVPPQAGIMVGIPRLT